MYFLRNLLFFDVVLIKYYSNLRSSILSFHQYFLGFCLLFVTFSKLFCCEVFDTFVIPLTFCCLSNYHLLLLFLEFKSSFKCICSRLFSMINKFLVILLPIFLLISLAKDKNPYPFTNIISLG